ncbi:MAG: autotransporter-associated beta strand repeat-containing protein [Rhodobacteraceae bacterium]|nr:autotransporter-associated beta strand repeat-containing protein [Paracoccaceae bacterium]
MARRFKKTAARTVSRKAAAKAATNAAAAESPRFTVRRAPLRRGVFLRSTALVLAPVAALMLAGFAAQAQDWAAGSGFWGDPSNWDPEVVPDSSAANVTVPAADPAPQTIDLDDDPFDVGTLTLNGGFDIIDPFTGGRLVVNDGVLVTGGQDTNISAILAGPGGLLKEGDGTLTLTGENTYTGTTTITNGTLALANAGSTLVDTNAVVIGAAGTLRLDADETLGSVAGAGNINLQDNTLTVGDGTDTTVSGEISGADGALVKQGTGTLTLTGNNTYTGGTAINAGAIAIEALDGVGTGTVQVNDDGTLRLIGGGDFVLEDLDIDGNGLLEMAGSGEATLSFGETLEMDFSNTGTGRVISLGGTIGGTLTNQGDGLIIVGEGSTIAADTIDNTDGEIDVQAGATLRSTGNTINNIATLNVATDGTVESTTGNVNNNGPDGVINFNGPGGTATLSADGQITNSGAINLFDGELDVVGAFTNESDGGDNGQVLLQGGDVTFDTNVTNKDDATFTIASGTTTIDNGDGTFSNEDSAVLNISDGATLAAALVNAATANIDGELDGTLTNTAGTTTINATGEVTVLTTITGGTVGNSGTLADVEISDGTFDNAGSVTGDTSVSGGIVNLNAGSDLLDTGTLAVTGGAVHVNTAEIVGTLDANGGTVITNENLTVGELTGGTDGSIVTTGTGGLIAGNGNTSTFAGEISGDGFLQKVGTGMLVLTAENTYTGLTTITAGTLGLAGLGGTLVDTNAVQIDVDGTLRLSVDETLGSVAGEGNIDLQGFTLTVGDASNNVVSGEISGVGGALVKQGSGTLTLTGDNTYDGATTISAGTLQIGDGGISGTLGAGDVAVDGSVLDFNRSDQLDVDNVITGDGTVNQIGTGTTILAGENAPGSQFTGTANVEAGILRVNGTFGDTDGNTATVNVNAGGTLQGTGTIGGNVTVNGDGTLAAGSSPGTLNIAGDLELNAASTSEFELGAADFFGGNGPNNDLVIVGGDLTLGGTLEIVDWAGGLTTGYYRLFNYDGALSDSFGTVNSPLAATVLTNIGGQVNLRLDDGSMPVQYWDGTDFTGNGAIDGGDGTWNATNTNWTNANGSFNDGWLGGEAIFQGTAGIVTINGAQDFQQLTFNVAGYELDGPGTLVSPNVGGFSIIAVNADATINAVIEGPGGINVIGGEVLTLGGQSTYAGATDIGPDTTLRTSADQRLPNATDVTLFDGATLDLDGNEETIRSLTSTFTTSTVDVDGSGRLVVNTPGSTTTTFAGNVTGDGALAHSGAGRLVLSGESDMTGSMFALDGTLEMAGGATTQALRVGAVNAGTFVTNGDALADNAILVTDAADSTVRLDGSETVGFLGDSGFPPGPGQGTIDLNGAGVVLELTGNANPHNAPGNSEHAGTITGAGALTVSGGTHRLSGENTYTGTTTVSGGTLELENGAAIADDGVVELTGTGQLVLEDDETIGSLEGIAGTTVDLQDNTLTTGGNDGDTEMAGVIEGTGGLVKDGDGTFTLSGVNTYTGLTTVAGGTLVNEGTIAGQVGIEAAGTFTNSGTATAGAVTNDGIFNAQGSITGFVLNNQTMTVTGDLGSAGLLTNNGTLTLEAGTATTTPAVENTGDITGFDGSSLTSLGVFTNAATGNLNFDIAGGTATVGSTGGAFINSGTIALTHSTGFGTLTIEADGGLNNASGSTISTDTGQVGDIVTVQGDVSGSTSLVLNEDLSVQDAGDSDVFVVTGTLGGTLDVEFTPAVPGVALQSNRIVFVDAGDLDPGFELTSVTGPPTGGGILDFFVTIDPSDSTIGLQVLPATSLGGVAGTLGSVQAIIGSVVNRPSSPFVSRVLFEPEGGCTPGGWARGIYGWADADTSTDFGTSGVSVPSSSSLRYRGLQGGFDLSCIDDGPGGFDYSVGVTLGVNDGTTRQDRFRFNPITGELDLGNPLSAITGSFNQRYVGLYAVAERENWAGDLQLRHERTALSFTNTDLGLYDETIRTRGTTLSGSVTYFHALENGMQLAPTAGFSISRTGSGSLAFRDTTDEVTELATLTADAHTSKVGFAGLSVARSEVNEEAQSATTVFVTSTLYNDFARSRTTRFQLAGDPDSTELTTSNLGAFGEFSVGMSYVRLFTDGAGPARQLNATLRGDARFSSRLESFGLTAQVRLNF